MQEWFETSLGRSIIEREIEKCGRLIPSGYYPNSMQVGLAYRDFLVHQEVSCRFMVDIDYPNGQTGHADDPGPARVYRTIADCSALPFPEKSQDLVILPHTLDICDEPHEVLRQVNQILTPEGCLVITGFNVISFYGLIKLFRVRSHNDLWAGQFYTVGRVQDWLRLLGYDLIGAGMMCYQPPLQSPKWRAKLELIEKAGDRWWPAMAGVYMIVARKREMSITPLPRRTRKWHQLLPGIAQPASQRAAKIGIRLVSRNP